MPNARIKIERQTTWVFKRARLVLISAIVVSVLLTIAAAEFNCASASTPVVAYASSTNNQDANTMVGQPATNQSAVIPEDFTQDAPATDSEDDSSDSESTTFEQMLSNEARKFTSREESASSIKTIILLGALSLAPALVLMTTCYIRVIVVLTLLKQAFGSQQLPPTQVLTALSLFITLLVMAPVWNDVKREAIDPYAQNESISWDEAWARGLVPVKKFMSRQIEVADNGEAVAMFYKHLPNRTGSAPPSSWDQIPVNVLLPAFVISELKVAFLLGFQIYLPFLVLDLVVSTVTVSMGMLMLPPTMVSFPLKLILFVLVDGWNLVIGMLLQSFAPYT